MIVKVKNKPLVYAFNDRGNVEQLRSQSDVPVNRLFDAFMSGSVDTDMPELAMLFDELWHPDAYRFGKYRLAGVMYDFSPCLTRFVVKYDFNDHWTEVHSLSKTVIRKLSCYKHNIREIVRIEKGE